MDCIVLGCNIKTCRKTRKLTRENLAKAVGISVQFLASIERGSSKPSLDTFVRIANALRVSADTLLHVPPPREQIEARRRECYIMMLKEMYSQTHPDAAAEEECPPIIPGGLLLGSAESRQGGTDRANCLKGS